MRAAAVILLVSASAAYAGGPRPASPLTTATATSASDTAWRVIENVRDDRGWCPAKGVGDSVTVSFAPGIPITSLTLYMGSIQSVDITAGKQKTSAKGGLPNVKLDGSVVDSLTLTITAVAPGKKPCFTGMRAVAPSGWFYEFVYGIEAAGMKALPDFAKSLDLALRTCDAAVLGPAIKFPLVHERDFPSPDGMSPPPASQKFTYKSAADLVKVCKTATSTLASGFADGSFGSNLATDIPLAHSEDLGQIKLGNWELVYAKGAWRLTHIETAIDDRSEMPTDEQTSSLVDPSKLATAYTPDATFVLLSGPSALVKATELAKRLDAPDKLVRSDDHDVYAMSRDGQSVWDAIDWAPKDSTTYRLSQLVVRTPAGWRIAGGMISAGQPNKAVNDTAKASKPFAAMPALPTDDGDASLRDAFKAMLAGPIDKDAAARKSLVAIGSGPGERTLTGAALAKPWSAAWAKHATLTGGITARLAPSGTTSWVIADIMLDKGTYKIPFRVMAVFDKTAAGTWSLVQAHLAVPAPAK